MWKKTSVTTKQLEKQNQHFFVRVGRVRRTRPAQTQWSIPSPSPSTPTFFVSLLSLILLRYSCVEQFHPSSSSRRRRKAFRLRVIWKSDQTHERNYYYQQQQQQQDCYHHEMRYVPCISVFAYFSLSSFCRYGWLKNYSRIHIIHPTTTILTYHMGWWECIRDRKWYVEGTYVSKEIPSISVEEWLSHFWNVCNNAGRMWRVFVFVTNILFSSSKPHPHSPMNARFFQAESMEKRIGLQRGVRWIDRYTKPMVGFATLQIQNVWIIVHGKGGRDWSSK